MTTQQGNGLRRGGGGVPRRFTPLRCPPPPARPARPERPFLWRLTQLCAKRLPGERMELNNIVIDRHSYVPLYVQVKDSLRDLILGGRAPGEQLPGEPELCRRYDVSRTVIRQALRDLELEGLILREKGRGTFVAEPKLREGLFQELTGFYSDMAGKGRPPVSRVLTQEIVAASRPLAATLRLRPGAEVVHIDRLRFVGDEPLVLVATYLPAARCPGLEVVDFTHRSLYAYLEMAYGLVIARGRRTLEAVAAGEYEAGLLGVKKGAPLILLDSVSYLADGSPIEYYRALHRGDRSRFEVELLRGINVSDE